MRRTAAGLALALASPPTLGADEALGRKVFSEVAQPTCATCHVLKAAGAAGTIGPSLDELRPDRERVIEAVRNGTGIMPAFSDKLTREQIEAVAAYVAKAAAAR